MDTILHMRRTTLNLFGIALLLILFLLGGCLAGPNELRDSVASDGSVAGFWLGLWHGAILPFTFLASLFNDRVSIYEVHNSGGWYNFGFLLGAAIIWGGGSASATRSNLASKSTNSSISVEEQDEEEDEEEQDHEEENERMVAAAHESSPFKHIPGQPWGDPSSYAKDLTSSELEQARDALLAREVELREHQEALRAREAENRERDASREREAREFLRSEADRILKEREERRDLGQNPSRGEE